MHAQSQRFSATLHTAHSSHMLTPFEGPPPSPVCHPNGTVGCKYILTLGYLYFPTLPKAHEKWLPRRSFRPWPQPWPLRSRCVPNMPSPRQSLVPSLLCEGRPALALGQVGHESPTNWMRAPVNDLETTQKSRKRVTFSTTPWVVEYVVEEACEEEGRALSPDPSLGPPAPKRSHTPEPCAKSKKVGRPKLTPVQKAESE